jgi:very-short-patch-repair endonuclease
MAGAVHRTRRGRYVLPTAAAHRREAHRLTGVLSHLSAAVARGWAVKTQPDRPWVTFPRKRHLMSADRDGIHAHWRHLDAAERTSGLTSPVRTVLDCAAALPFDEALAVADSALRDGDVTKAQLVAAAAQLRGPGSARARRVVALADHRAANPFESALRALAMEFSELTFEPQLRIWDTGLWATVDLGDEVHRIVLEAEGFASHSSRKDLVRDCHRYAELTVWGWAVLRFSWEDVMLRPERVRWAIGALLEQRAGRPVPPPPS